MKHSFTGLSYSQENESREKFGSNELSPYKVESFWDKLAENFKDPTPQLKAFIATARLNYTRPLLPWGGILLIQPLACPKPTV